MVIYSRYTSHSYKERVHWPISDQIFFDKIVYLANLINNFNTGLNVNRLEHSEPNRWWNFFSSLTYFWLRILTNTPQLCFSYYVATTMNRMPPGSCNRCSLSWHSIRTRTCLVALNDYAFQHFMISTSLSQLGHKGFINIETWRMDSPSIQHLSSKSSPPLLIFELISHAQFRHEGIAENM